MAAETEQMRNRRRHRRALFEGVADRYQNSRPGYPPELVQFVINTARLRADSAVLDVGCGTGQLTGQLAEHGLAVTAIDIGASMIETARRRIGTRRICFDVVAFEEFEAPEASFDLIISATAFHWIDPEVKFARAARLLRGGGWLALLNTRERYADPFGAALLQMWITRADGRGAWAGRGTNPETDFTGAADRFGPPIERSHVQPAVLPAETVIARETTRATFLSWPEHARLDFLGELRRELSGRAEVRLTQETSLAMAQVRGRG